MYSAIRAVCPSVVPYAIKILVTSNLSHGVFCWWVVRLPGAVVDPYSNLHSTVVAVQGQRSPEPFQEDLFAESQPR
jgi:hypothetical protein